MSDGRLSIVGACTGQGGSPDRLAAEELEGGVNGDDGEILDKTLRGDKAVERVAVVGLKLRSGEGMLQRDRQDYNAVQSAGL